MSGVSGPGHPGGGASGYSMQGVMDFLREQELKAHDRELKLIAEKRALEDRVKNLEDELQKQVLLNKEMAKKVRMIEVQVHKRGEGSAAKPGLSVGNATGTIKSGTVNQ
jgi:hypothetical protein